MTRIFPDYTYGPGPRKNCWWDQTIAAPDWPALQGSAKADVAIIGGGFTGVNAALRLAEAGLSVIVCEAGPPGFGASGRNGGFCCLGGGKISNAALTRTFGSDGRRAYRQAEVAAITHVASHLDRFSIDADRHSDGETQLAHSPRVAARFRAEADEIAEDYGVACRIDDDTRAVGMATKCHGALTIPLGFALNPRKYLFGLARAAEAAGVRFCADTRIMGMERDGSGHRLISQNGDIRADRVIIATNGYSADDLPDWLAARYIPAQSSVLVTRPLTQAELDAQGWTSRQMTYDSRNLLHYFRLMPDNRFLFGMRGGILSSPRVEAVALARVRRDFEAMFPAWSGVDAPFGWSGMVCLTRNETPFVGAVPDRPGLYAALGYHGNGVAMGSYTGKLLAELAQGQTPDLYPAAMQRPLPRFPLGRGRRALMPFVYAGLALGDL